MRVKSPFASIGILDDSDAPQPDMLVALWGDPSEPFFDYIWHGLRRPPAPRRVHHMMRFTSLGDFGMTAAFTEGGYLRVIPSHRPCVAQYPDGTPRNWQGLWRGLRRPNIIAIRPGVLNHVWRAVQTIQEIEANLARTMAEFELDRALCRIGAGLTAAGSAALYQIEGDLAVEERRVEHLLQRYSA
jgi:hypothetical protein